MSKLAAIQKQIAALQEKAEKITKHELAGAVAKVKAFMSKAGVTIEHLKESSVGKATSKKAAAAKGNRTAKPRAPSAAKYADPKTGKTWSGFGRAPAWIATAKNRDLFLIGAAKQTPKHAAPKKKAATKAEAPALKTVKAKASTAFKPSTKKTVAPKAAPKKAPAAKKSAPTKAVKAKAAPKKSAAPKAAATDSVPELVVSPQIAS